MHFKHFGPMDRSDADKAERRRARREEFLRSREVFRAEFTMHGGHGGHGGRDRFRGPGRGGPGFPDDPRGFGFPGGPFGGRRRVGRGDVRNGILRLLAEGGSWNGYQIIQELTNRSGDAWKPSPGSIYPALQQLQDEGLILAEETEGKRSYTLSEEGKTAAANLGGEAAPWDIAAEGVGTDVFELRGLVQQVSVAAMQVMQAGNKAQVDKAKETMTATRRSLYRILAEDEELSADSR